LRSERAQAFIPKHLLAASRFSTWPENAHPSASKAMHFTGQPDSHLRGIPVPEIGGWQALLPNPLPICETCRVAPFAALWHN